MLRSHQAACPVTVIDSTVSSPPSPPGVSGGTADTLSWNEMPLPNKLLSQRPRGAAASGSCCFRVPIHPGRVWLGDTKIDQWRNKQAGCSAITMELLCKFNPSACSEGPFLSCSCCSSLSSWLIWIWLSKYCLLVHPESTSFQKQATQGTLVLPQNPKVLQALLGSMNCQPPIPRFGEEVVLILLHPEIFIEPIPWVLTEGQKG